MSTMSSSWNLILALLLTAVAAVLAVFAVRRRALRVDAAEHKTDLQTWESEGGSQVPAVKKPPSRSEANSATHK